VNSKFGGAPLVKTSSCNFASFSTLVPSALLVLVCLFGASATAQTAKPAPGTFVKTALGGFILGYDIDQNGTEGLLSESLTLSDGNYNVATETFDHTTGKILKIVSQQTETKNDFVTCGIFGTSVGLVEQEKSKGIFVDKRLYATINPLSGNKLNGKWTPPLTKNQLIIGATPNQNATNMALLVPQGFNSFVMSSNVTANTFGPVVNLTDQIFGFNDSPVIAIDNTTNQAVVAASNGGIMESPKIAVANLTTGNVTEFQGIGFGFANGIAVDSADGVAVTSTEIDFSLEFYDLATQTGFIVPLHNATNQSQSGGAVAFDPINKLFLVGQEFSSTAASGSSIQVFDTKGNFVKAINGLNLPASPAYMALNPAQRFGYVIVTPALTQLQAFAY
jgi:hypothetical protein